MAKQLTFDELPNDVKEKVQKLSQRMNVEIGEIVRQISDKYNDEFVQTDPQFKTDADRIRYAFKVVYVQYVSQPPPKPATVIPFGFTSPRYTRSGVLMARIYAFVKFQDEEKAKKRVIIAKGATARELISEIVLFSTYTTRLAQLGGDGICLATTSTNFSTPQPLNVEPLTFVTRYVGAVPVKIAETPFNLSKRQDRYVDEWDLKLVRGIVLRYNTGTRDDGTHWAVYTIADDSIGETQVTKDGIVIPTQFTVWVPYEQLKYAENSEIACVGTIGLGGNNEPFMNAIAVIPIHAIPIER